MKAHVVGSAAQTAETRRRSHHMARLRRALYAYLLLAPAAISIAVVIGYPLIQNYRLSLTNAKINEGQFIGLRNYQQLFADPLFWLSVKNNLTLLLAVPILTGLSIVIAFLLYQQIAGWRIYRALLFLPYVLPIVVVGVVFNYILTKNGFLNTGLRTIGLDILALDWIGSSRTAIFSILLLIVWKQLGFGVVLCLARLLSIDRTLFEAARIDGASATQALRYVAIPLLVPVIEFYVVWNVLSELAFVFGYVYALTGGGPGESSYVVELYILRLGVRNALMGAAAAAAGVLIIAITVFIILQVRFFSSKAEMD